MKTARKTHRLILASITLALAAGSGASMAQSATGTAHAGKSQSTEERTDASKHLEKTAQVLQKMQQDRQLAALMKRSKAVFVVPDYGRAAVGVGARGGAGVLLVRRGATWSDPAFYNMGGISAGLQAGVEAGPIALVLNNQKALDAFKQDNKFSLNAGAGLTLVNWSAKGQASAGRGDITIWSDTKGLFGGASVSITDVNFDQKETAAYYNREVAARDVVSGKVTDPNPAGLRQILASAGTGSAASSTGTSGTSGTSESGNPNNRK